MSEQNQQQQHQQDAIQANPGGMRPRRQSITERLIGNSREWFTQFYKEEEKDEGMFGTGFNDPTDDFIPGVVYSERRRRTMSMGSDASMDSFDGQYRGRSGSLTERVAGMKVKAQANPILTKRRGSSDAVGDIDDFSVLF